MTKTDGNAFMHPTTWQEANGAVLCVPGITKREYFAAMAMQGLLATEPENYYVEWPELAVNATRMADALITALNEQEAK